MRVGCYLRVSSEEQAAHGYSLDHQLNACQERARSLGALSVQVYKDEGVSGALLHRPALDRLRRDVGAQHLDCIVVYDPDRLARSLTHQLLLTEEVERRGVRLEFVNFEWQNTPEGRLFYSLRGAVAEYEKEKIRERTVSGRVQKARQGKLPVGVSPYGYRYVAETSELAIDPVEGHVVQRIFEAWSIKTRSLSDIARTLSAEHIPTRQGRDTWHRQTVRQILKNPVYTGTFYSRRYDCSNVGLNRYQPPGHKAIPRERPPEEWIPVPVPRLIASPLWALAQSRFANARRRAHGRESHYLLSGLVKCQRCGSPMPGTERKEWGRPVRCYVCAERGCGHSVPAAPLEGLVWEPIAAWLTDPGRLAAALHQRSGKGDDDTSDTEARRLRKAQEGLETALARGLGDVEALLRRLDQVTRRLETLEAPAPSSATQLPSWDAVAVVWCRRSGEWPLELRRHLVQSLVFEVRVDRPHVSMELVARPMLGDGHRIGNLDAPAQSPEIQP